MVPINIIKQWRQQAPWVYQSQVEQDLVLSRALVSLYQNELIRDSLAFRGGTALNKLFITPAARYSEDIDLVQVNDEPIGHIFTAIRGVLDPWLGSARWSQNANSARFIYRFQSEDTPAVPLRLKIEINTKEFFSLYGYQNYSYAIESRWFSGQSNIKSYQLEELMGTKLRALYQRTKGRDLFDLWLGITKLNMDCSQVIESFAHYNKTNDISISRAELESNLTPKMNTVEFTADISPLLSEGIDWNPEEAYALVMDQLIAKLPGRPWKKL